MTAPSWNVPSGGWGRWSWGKWGSSVADEPRPGAWATASRDSDAWWSSGADDPESSWTQARWQLTPSSGWQPTQAPEEEEEEEEPAEEEEKEAEPALKPLRSTGRRKAVSTRPPW